MTDPRQGAEDLEPQPPEPLSLKTRLALFVVGWALVVIGILGLALPGIQGILTIVIGASVLSLVSEWFHRVMERIFGRWPKVWARIDGWRSRLHRRLAPKPRDAP